MAVSQTINRDSGFSYVEILVTTVLIVLVLVPAMEALNTSSKGQVVHAEMTSEQLALLDLMESTLAESFETLSFSALGPTTPSAFSDSLGTSPRHIVYISAWDVDDDDGDNDPFTGTDPNILWIRVETEHTDYALEALTSQ